MFRRMTILAGAALLAASGAGLSHDKAHVTDAQIAHVAYTAGQIDVDNAKQALDKSSDREVRAFAETMLRDHQAVNRQAVALVTKLGVTPAANPTSTALAQQAAEKRQALARLNGRNFDKAYVENEAAYHRTVNDALKGTLIPGAKNAELKSLLEAGLALFSEHQAHAEQLAGKLR